MTARLDNRFASLKAAGRAGLVTFTMAFDPNRTVAQNVLNGLPAAGADVIELGIPFSDPVADGPTIQLAGQRALDAGATLNGVLEMVREFRKTDSETPIILMGYYNPVFRYGTEKFVADAVAAGVDGSILVDLPPEELAEIQPHADKHGFAVIRLVAPTTGDARLASMLQGARGFAYYIAVAGITGAGSADLAVLEQRVKHLKSQTSLPLAVGFGVKTPEQAAAIAAFADAVVVGSALVKTLDEQGTDAALALVRDLADGVRGKVKVS